MRNATDADFMISRLELNDSQATLYRQLRDSFMTATQPQRDSADSALRAMREEFQGGIATPPAGRTVLYVTCMMTWGSARRNSTLL